MQPPSKYLGDDHFQSILSEIECNMPAYEIRAYLLGFVIAIETVPFSFIMDEILLTGTDSKVVFENEEQASRFSSQLIALWNTIADDIDKGKVPKLRKLPKNLKDGGLLLMALVSRDNEIDSLLGALAEGSTHVDNCPDPKASEVLDWLEAHLDVYVEILELMEKNEETKNDLLKAEIVLLAFDDRWPENFKILEKGLRKIRLTEVKRKKKEMTINREIHIVKTGRNDPCPCGSGKKHKKCCGIIH